jgi:biotin carboxyl carrier protein
MATMPSGYLVGAPDGAEGGSWFTVRRWYVSDGDRIEEGQPLVRLHNEMGLSFELPAPRAGFVSIIVGEHDTVGAGTVLCDIRPG